MLLKLQKSHNESFELCISAWDKRKCVEGVVHVMKNVLPKD